MDFQKIVEKMEFAKNAGEMISITRESWNGDCHIASVTVPGYASDLFVHPHNIENFAVKYHPSAEDISATDWVEWNAVPKIIV